MWAEDARRAAETYAVGMASRLEQAGLVAEGLALTAMPAAGIIAVANQVDADLIVLSAHARRGGARSMLGERDRRGGEKVAAAGSRHSA